MRQARALFKMLNSFLAIVAILISTSCTPKKMASNLTSKIMAGGATSFEMEPDFGIAEDTGITLIKMIEAMQYDNPNNKTFKLILSRSYANYSFGFLEWNMLRYRDVKPEKYNLNEERAKRFYASGQRLGLDVLSTSGVFKNALTGDMTKFQKALKNFGKGDVPKLFWTAFNWGSLINLSKDSPQALIAYPKVEAMMQRVAELDEHYFYDGPNLFFGVSYGSRPQMFGGNPQKSKEYFEKAIRSYNRKFLMAIVLYAQTYAVQMQDPVLFDTLLNEVAVADPAALPEQRLANELAVERAKWLLANKDKFFDMEEMEKEVIN
jgi:hypothetical protein